MDPRRTSRIFASLRGAGKLAAAACVSVALLVPANAQFWGGWGSRTSQPQRSSPQQPSFNPFGSLFGGSSQSRRSSRQQPSFNPFGSLFGGSPQPPREAPADYSRAPPPQRKADPAAAAATTTLVVMGDGMADWLAYGLEEAFAENPDIAIVRRHRTYSGLIRYDSRRDIEWAQVAKETIAADKPKFIIMMVGVHDRQAIRERPAATPARHNTATKRAPASVPRPAPAPLDLELQAQQSADQQNAELQEAASEEPTPATPESARGAATNKTGPFEFRSERWEAGYIRRIDATIAAMKNAGVPVFWVGLPPQRGSRASADSTYLNELYRQRAEKAGIVYIDVWDGFVDSAGQFAAQGPDFEGQIRRLRSGDGVYFTKAGARKLAHYVEREIQRTMANRAVPVALPAVEPAPATQGSRLGGPTQRPLAGPVIPLTVLTVGSGELLGGGPARPAPADPIATRVLVKGESISAPSGRADDFSWPRNNAEAESSSANISYAPLAPATSQPEAGQAKVEPAAASSKAGEAKQQIRRRSVAPPPAADGVLRPPAPIRPSASVPQRTVR